MNTFIPKNPDFLSLIQDKMKENHFMQHLGFSIHKIEPGMVEGILDIAPEHRQHLGFLHGGVSATLADLVAGFASFTLVEPTQSVVTVEMKISYLNPGIGDKAYCKGYVIKAGQKLIFAEAEIYVNNEEKDFLVAKGYATYAVIENPKL
ncbi:MAG: PaaI family thioesterase [Bacteroidia bacterium]|nr:PaaI family thioesterase [Bacteroidia bacterium]